MKQGIFQKLAIVFMLTFAVAIPTTTWFVDEVVVEAAVKAPTLNVTKKTIRGTLGKTYTLKVNNKPSKATYTWSSSNKKVATVNKSGKVTTVKKGSVTIKCKVEYKDANKKTISKTLSCKVTVQVPATSIKISNAQIGGDGFQEIIVGETYDFNRSITPKTSSDKTYWTVQNTEIATVDSAGVVTALKPGTTNLYATAAASKTAATSTNTEKVQADIVIKVVEKMASVSSVELIDGTHLKVVFSEGVTKDSVFLDEKGTLGAVTISTTATSSASSSNTLGTITGSLSEDGTILTIGTQNAFKGTYFIDISGVVTLTNIMVRDYEKTISLSDTTGPQFVGSTNDVTGLKSIMEFSEPISITDMKVVGVVSNSGTISSITEAILKNVGNYKVSEDRLKLTINLASIETVDKNKSFSITLSGLKDISGNYSEPYPLVVFASTDTTERPQATLVSLVRTDAETLTATFSAPIKTPGTARVVSNPINGVVDATDPTIVRYVLSSYEQGLTGDRSVYLSGWSGYNVSGSNSTYTSTNISFTMSTVKPQLVSYELQTTVENNTETNILLLNYDNKVKIINATGSLTASIRDTKDNIVPGASLTYTSLVNDKTVKLILSNSSVSSLGTYTITIPQGFISDIYGNKADATTLIVVKEANESNTLQPPKTITQDPTNPSVIIISFMNKLDVLSAENTSNYKFLGGPVVEKAEIAAQTDQEATVRLTLAEGSVSIDGMSYPFTISNIQGYNSNYSGMEPYNVEVKLKDNVVPTITTARFTTSNTITLYFSEPVKGNVSFTVKQGSEIYATVTDFTQNTTTATLTLPTIPNTVDPCYLVETQFNTVTDSNENYLKVSDNYYIYR